MRKESFAVAAGCSLVMLSGYGPASAQRVNAAAPQSKTGDDQGMSRERLARISGAMKEQFEKGTFPGAVTVVARRGQVVHFEANGFLDAAKSKPIVKDSLFRLASMTKPIVSAAAMMLIERGTVKLNDPISIWLPELKDMKVEAPVTDKDGKITTEDVPAARPILVHDLLRHTAGFVYAGSTKSARIKEAYEKANIEAREVDISGDDMLKALGQIPLAHHPGGVFPAMRREIPQ